MLQHSVLYPGHVSHNYEQTLRKLRALNVKFCIDLHKPFSQINQPLHSLLSCWQT